ncbi:MAG: TonB family protein [Thermoanaerobaculia bacterium]
MHDAVAEVLAQRSRISRGGARRGIAASLALHAIALSALFLGASQTLPRAATPNVVNIRFAPASQAPVMAAPAPVKAAPPPPAVKVEEPPPAKREAFAPKQESLFGKSDRKVEPPAATPVAPATKAPPPASGTADASAFATPGVGTAGVTGLEGGDFPYTIYVNQMVSKVGSNWLRPQAGGEPLAEVYFVINRDGTIRDAKIATASGNSTFDRAALRAVLSSSPLPPLPFGYSGTWLGVRLTFH